MSSLLSENKLELKDLAKMFEDHNVAKEYYE